MEHFISDLKASASAENRAFFPHAGNNDFIFSEKSRKKTFRKQLRDAERKTNVNRMRYVDPRTAFVTLCTSM